MVWAIDLTDDRPSPRVTTSDRYRTRRQSVAIELSSPGNPGLSPGIAARPPRKFTEKG